MTGENIVYTKAVYVESNLATGDGARRFEDSFLYLKDMIIKVSTFAQLFGDSSNQTYEVGVGEVISLSGLDISTLYFKNVGAGDHGKVDILGVKR